MNDLLIIGLFHFNYQAQNNDLCSEDHAPAFMGIHAL